MSLTLRRSTKSIGHTPLVLEQFGTVDQTNTAFSTKALLELHPVYRELIKPYLNSGSTMAQWLSVAAMENWNVNPKVVLEGIVENQDLLTLWEDKPRQQELVTDIIVENLTTNDVEILSRLGIAALKGPFEF